MLLGVIFVIFVFAVSLLYIEHKKREPVKLFGIYTQPGKWYCFKYLLFLGLLQIKKFRNKIGRNEKRMVFSIKEDDLEQVQALSTHAKAVDSVFFQASNREGFYICGGLERRHEGKSCGLFHIAVPGVGLLSNEKLPETNLIADPVSIHTLKEYSAEGIRFIPVEPMKKWKIAFEGKMRNEADPSKLLQVKLEGDWSSNSPHFLYDTQISSRALARAIAKEKWSRTYFKKLQDSNLSHYEQMGRIKGKLEIDGKEYNLEMDSFRDHSFAYKRDWSEINRYVSHSIHLDNGIKASILVYSLPYLTQIEVGFVSNPDKTNHAIESCNFKLYQHGENGRPGKDYGFTFKANGETFDAKFVTEYQSEHFKGNMREARVLERFMTCEVNGIRGRALCEWNYNNVKKCNC